MRDALPIGLTAEELETLDYALKVALINCHESKESEIALVAARLRAFMAAYGVRSWP